MLAPSPLFLQSLQASLTYWEARARSLSEHQYHAFEQYFPNLLRALEAGFAFSETQAPATQLVLEMFNFIEFRNYARVWLLVLAHALSGPVHSPSIHGQLLNQMGFLHMLNREIPQALARHHEAEAWARTNDNLFNLANAKLGLAQDYFANHQFEQGTDAGQQALALFSQLAIHPKKQAAAHNILGMIAHALGNYEMAEKAFLQAIEICCALDSPTLSAQYLNNLAISLSAAQKYAQALEYHQKALALLENHASPITKVFTQNALGGVYFSLARYAEAEAAFKAMDTKYLQQSGAIYWLATQANNLGNVYLKQNLFVGAETSFRRALQFWKQLDDEINYANTLGDLAETLSHVAQSQEAVPLYEEAIQILAHYPQHAWASNRHARLITQKTALAAGLKPKGGYFGK